ncbi:DUF4874 domain-containing protein [Paenibacillus contaminans]|uniref:DUF4832 domain-containing protein n=1 Tax=Paenibacillus contaminans TaxID=450362 RepID=A0A329MHD4_9BACL|nr:DUF4874 domain-containing protein [Paenibacillus contaminans]RAV19180.1 hypothetical protein DQG23_21820 [Paenibacillus contaminans]
MNHVQKIALRPLPGSKSTELLRNPDRGFRLEIALDVGRNYNSHVPEVSGTTAFLQKHYEDYKGDCPMLAQTYFYLSAYENKDLDDIAFDTMQIFLDELRQMGMRALLRFAYQMGYYGPECADRDQMLRHMEQLAPFIRKNKDVIHVYQAGFIGSWGEWHSSKYEFDRKEMLESILRMVPEELQVQVRLPEYKGLLGNDHPQYKRVGFHDDFIAIKPNSGDGGLIPGSAQYAQFCEESPFLLIDGELPWGEWSFGDGWYIDPYGTIMRLAEHHYTSLSLIHNNREEYYRQGDDDGKYSMEYWKEIGIDPSWLQLNRLPYADAWFLDEHGNEIRRTTFDYIRDHLGYYLQAGRLEIGMLREKQLASLTLELRNYGFAAPHGLESAAFVWIDQQGNEIQASSAGDPRHWHPHEPGDAKRSLLAHVVQASLPLPEHAGVYRLGLKIGNSAGHSVRIANDIPFVQGVNVLTEVEWQA